MLPLLNCSPRLHSATESALFTVIATSEDEGNDWKVKMLPVGLPHSGDKANYSTLGYATVRQAPNGVIHILSTLTHPPIHYELNEAWLFNQEAPPNQASQAAPSSRLHVASGSGQHSPAMTPAASLSRAVRSTFEEHAADGSVRASWTATYGPGVPRGYALDGALNTFYPGGSQVEYAATFVDGQPVDQRLYENDGRLLWQWDHDHTFGNSTLVQYWDTHGGTLKPRLRSTWLNRAQARDWAMVPTNTPKSFRFDGLVADGPAVIFDLDGKPIAKSSFAQGELVQPTA